VGDTPIDNDIDMESAELLYPNTQPSNNRSLEREQPTGSERTDLQPVGEIQEHQSASTKPKIIIRIPSRRHIQEEIPSPSSEAHVSSPHPGLTS